MEVEIRTSEPRDPTASKTRVLHLHFYLHNDFILFHRLIFHVPANMATTASELHILQPLVSEKLPEPHSYPKEGFLLTQLRVFPWTSRGQE